MTAPERAESPARSADESALSADESLRGTSLGRLLRRSRWPVVAVWLVFIMLIHPFAGSLYRVTDDSAAANLPSSAQSTRVVAIQNAHGNHSAHDSLAVVFVSHGPIDAADAARVDAVRNAIAALQVPGLAAPGPVKRSPDGRAALFTTTVTAVEPHRRDDDTVAVRAVRTAVRRSMRSTAGLHTSVTGSAAVTADQGDTSQGTLLLTALLIVGAVLILAYRSAIVWLFPLVGALAAIVLAQAATHLLGEHLITVSTLSTSILIVLVFGAASDYALLLVHRYRDELAHHDRTEEAMAVALRATVPTLLASACTVIGAMLCLLAARSAALHGLGPVGAVSIAAALLAQTTFLPAMLLLVGRRAFWPRTPAVSGAAPTGGLWSRLAVKVQRRPLTVIVVGTVLLVAACAGVGDVRPDNDPLAGVRGTPESVTGATAISAHFGPGATAPLTVLVPRGGEPGAARALAGLPAVRTVSSGAAIGDRDQLSVTLDVDPYTSAGRSAVADVRKTLGRVVPSALVGGDAAIGADTTSAAQHDAAVLMPLILLVILLVIGVLLRAVVAAVALVVTTALSFGAALGLSALLWRHVLGFPGVESQLPMYLFVFLIALGVDYNIFLAARIREESTDHGTRTGTRNGLASTGGVITAAGIVLAGTFLALTSSPRIDLTEVGTGIAIGVLLDTLLVRTILVPAIFFSLGRRVWWPSHARVLEDLP